MGNRGGRFLRLSAAEDFDAAELRTREAGALFPLPADVKALLIFIPVRRARGSNQEDQVAEDKECQDSQEHAHAPGIAADG
jgi:hypothetical protein